MRPNDLTAVYFYFRRFIFIFICPYIGAGVDVPNHDAAYCFDIVASSETNHSL